MKLLLATTRFSFWYWKFGGTVKITLYVHMVQFRIWHVTMILSPTWNSHNFDFRWAIYDIGTKKRNNTKIQFPRWWLNSFRSSCTPLFTGRAHLIFYLKNRGKSQIQAKFRDKNPIVSLCKFTLDACKWGCPRTIPETYHSNIGPWLVWFPNPLAAGSDFFKSDGDPV